MYVCDMTPDPSADSLKLLCWLSYSCVLNELDAQMLNGDVIGNNCLSAL